MEKKRMRLPKLQKRQNANDSNQTARKEQWNCSPTTRGFGSKQGWSGGGRSPENGFAALGAVLVLIFFICGVGSFLILHQIKNKTKMQIELDQFTGSTIIQLRASIITLESSEKRLRIAYTAMLAGCVYPPSCAAFQSAYQLQKKIEMGIQEIAEKHWDTQKLKWMMEKPILSFKNPIPTIHELKNIKTLTLQIQYGSLISASKLWKEKGVNPHDWNIAWIK